MISTHLYAIDDLTVISSTKDVLIVEYTPKITDSSKVKIDNNDFIRFNINEGICKNGKDFGAPLLPGRILSVGVPSGSGNTFEIIKSEYVDFKGLPLPIAKQAKEGTLSKEVFELNEQYYSSRINENIVSFGKFGKMRNLNVQQFLISPIQFDYQAKTIRFYKKIVLRINFAEGQKNSGAAASDLLKGVVANFETAKNWAVSSQNNLSKANAIKSSVLATGRWFRFDATEEGIYKISKTMLASYGIDANSVDPRTIKIYNNGGKILPETISAERPADLVENAIMIVGEDDGKFDDNDYILFYGRGINFPDYDKSSLKLKSFFNNYSNHNYFWITSSGEKGKRIQNKSSLTETQKYIQNTSKALLYKKDEKINLAKSGRYFYGDDFSQTTKSRIYTNTLDGILANSTLNYNMSFINSYDNSILLNVEENSSLIYTASIDGKNTDSENDYSFGRETAFSTKFTGTLTDSKSILKFTFNSNSVSSLGYLNFFEIAYTKELKPAGDYLLFFSKDTTSVIEYQISNFTSSNISVFDVTDYSTVKLIDKPVMQSGGEYRFQSSEKTGEVSKYIALSPGSYRTPANPQEVSNQNIRGFAQGSKLIIITAKDFLDQANRLKTYRESSGKESISTTIYQCNQIFNEFSGGSTDVSAIRDFIKYAYENWTVKPDYVLLFGDGDYDYKDIEKNGRNFVIPWETEQSLHQIYSFCSDDFYARIEGDDDFVDIAIGRVNVQNNTDATGYITKLINYETNSEKTTWRNLITLIADDGWTSPINDDGSVHTSQSEDLYENNIPASFTVKKIYLAEYPAILVSGNRTKPAVNQAIIDAINEGSLIVNYVGHGNPNVLAHEKVFQKTETIPQFVNDKYFFLTAATCDFGYYDDPSSQSSTELLLLKTDGGCIGSISAVRPVYGNLNAMLNNTFYGFLLNSPRDANNLPMSIGTAYFKSKALHTTENDQKFHLFGDPSIRLIIPQNKALIDSVNGISSTVGDIQVKALSRLTMKGTIKKADGSVWSDFNGEGVLTVFDANRSLYLPEIAYSVEIQGGLIFNGKISIQNGNFTASCVVPKDISYENKKGTIRLYFYNQKEDGLAFFNQIVVGGSDTTVVNDKKGPQIEIYFDNAEMKNSELVNSNSTLIVKLKDDAGLNASGTGIGHKLEGILNKDENNPIDFTNFYTGDLDSGGKTGKIIYKLGNLNPGVYDLKVKAWDVFNNPSESSVDFSVVSGNDLEIRNIYNYPNPFKASTTFTFQQNFAVPLNVKIKIFAVSGRMIKEIERSNISEKFVKIDWDGRDQDENQIANGTYLYKIIVKTADGAFTKDVTGKLAILR